MGLGKLIGERNTSGGWDHRGDGSHETSAVAVVLYLLSLSTRLWAPPRAETVREWVLLWGFGNDLLLLGEDAVSRLCSLASAVVSAVPGRSYFTSAVARSMAVAAVKGPD